MLIKRFVTGLFSLAAVLLLVSPSPAQREIHHVPPVISEQGNNPDVFHPFMHPAGTYGQTALLPFATDPDFQFFKLDDFSTFGRGPQANQGFFATYDRLYIWVTRPEDQAAAGVYPGTPGQIVADEKGGDFTWGNRYDLGYMSDEDHGWLTTFWHIDGPNYYNDLLVERVDVQEPDASPDNVIGLRGGNGTLAGNPNVPLLPRRDRNLALDDERNFIVRNSVNVADLSSWEFNKTFRVKSLHYGNVVEPFFGFRYMKFQDYYQRSQYQRYESTTAAPLNFNLPIPPTDITNYFIEDLLTQTARFDNHMIGGQVGLRWFKQKQRWLLSGEMRVFATQNFQSFVAGTGVERTYFSDLSADADIDTVVYNKNETADHRAEFVYGSEIRGEAAYAVSRDFSLRVGMAFMGFGRGIGRGNNINNNDQDVTMVGGTFGFTVNR